MDGLFCYHLVVMFVATVAMLLMCVGFTTPGWFVVTFQEDYAAQEYTVSSLNRSLYYDILCPQELKTCEPCEGGQSPGECIEQPYDARNYTYHYTWVSALIQQKEEWTAWRVIMTIVIVAALVGWILVLVLVCCLLRPSVYRIIATTAFFAWLIAAILTWIPVGMVADMHLDVDDTIDDDVSHDATLHTPYSVVIAAVGAIIALVTAIMLIYLIGVCCPSDRSTETRSDTELFSERSKPTATMIHDGRYYGPYPYYNPEPQAVYREEPPIAYQMATAPAQPYAQSYKYPVSLMEEEVRSEHPYYRGERWYDNRAFSTSLNPKL